MADIVMTYIVMIYMFMALLSICADDHKCTVPSAYIHANADVHSACLHASMLASLHAFVFLCFFLSGYQQTYASLCTRTHVQALGLSADREYHRRVQCAVAVGRCYHLSRGLTPRL